MRISFAVFLVVLFASPVLANSVADVLDANKAAMGGNAWDNKITLKTEYAFSGQGMTGKTWSVADLRDGRNTSGYQIGPISGGSGYDGKNAWVKDPSGTVTSQGGDSLASAVNDAYRTANLWWRKDMAGAKIATQGNKTDKGKQFDVLAITPKDGRTFEIWLDGQTHLIARILEKQGARTITSYLSDYRTISGAKISGKIVIDGGEGPKYQQVLTFTKAEFAPAQDASVFTAPKITVSDYSILEGGKETTFPMRILNNHIYADVTVNGKGPYTFIFDTGGANLVTPAVARELGLKTEGHLAAHGAGEGMMEAGLTKVSELKIGNAVLKNQPFVVLPLDAMSDVEGIKEKGMVGFETFRRFVTRIDYQAGTVSLMDPKNFSSRDAGVPVPFHFKESIPEVKGEFEGIPGIFDIDTGSRADLTLTKGFAEANGLRAKHLKGVDAVDGWGVGGPSRGYVTRGTLLKIGSVEVSNFVASFGTQSKGAFAGTEFSGNIGSGILKRFVVTFDYEHQLMYLKPALRPVVDAGVFDRSGMWINASDAGFKIMDVTAGGPAAEAGLKTDDVIVSVDGTSAREIPLYDFRKKLRGDPGTKINLGMRNGKSVTVTLRDQI